MFWRVQQFLLQLFTLRRAVAYKRWTNHVAATTATRRSISNQHLPPTPLLLSLPPFHSLCMNLVNLPVATTTAITPKVSSSSPSSTTLVTTSSWSLFPSSLLYPYSTTLSKILLDIAIWFAAPKRKHTKSRKRKKTTISKRIPLRKNIVFDLPTGEVTLKHKLPYKWKELYNHAPASSGSQN
jgi:ribosomal protein L32